MDQFVGAFKSCIINGLAYQDVEKGSKCEVDDASLLSNLQTLLTSDNLNLTSRMSSVGSEEGTAEMSFLDEQQDSLPIGAQRDRELLLEQFMRKCSATEPLCKSYSSSVLDSLSTSSRDFTSLPVLPSQQQHTLLTVPIIVYLNYSYKLSFL